MNLKELFDVRILARGREYFKSNLITDLHLDGDTLTASVQGSEEYDVTIAMVNGEPYDMDCSCPYAADGHNCKHMAAVLLAYDAEPNNPKRHSEHPSPAELIASADADTLRSFLLQKVSQDSALLASLELYLNRREGTIDLASYRHSIKAVIRQFSDRHGFIDYNSAYDFLEAMEQYLEEDVTDLADTGHIAEAFELCNMLFKAFSDVDMDDDGEFSQFGSDTVEAWGKIISRADVTQKEKMFQWFMAHLNGWVIDFMEDYIEQAVFEYFDEPEYLKQKLVYTDGLIAQTDTDSYQYASLLLRRICLMEQMQAPEHELLVFCTQFETIPKVRSFLINYYISHEKNTDAVSLLESAVKTARPYDAVKEYREKLTMLYQKLGAENKYREQLWHLAADHGDLEYYHILKKLFSKKEWETVRERLFDETSQSFCANFYAEDELWDRLMDYVTHEGHISTLKQYEKHLVKQYPEQVLTLYADALNAAAKGSAGRSVYREWAGHLKHMKTIPGGEEKARRIAEAWKLQYKNRPAMLEELRKAGF